MKKLNINTCLNLLLLSCYWLNSSALAATPAGLDKLHILTGIPTSNGDNLFSATVQWRVDGKHVIEGTGMAFINGPDKMKPDNAAMVATKLKSALNDVLAEKYPNSRGMEISGPKKQAELTIANVAGFSFTRVTTRDYSNSSVSYDLLGKSFSANSVGVSIDLVYSADVAYIDDFASEIKHIATGGTVTITIDDGKPVVIRTNNKTTAAIERELANAISQAHYSSNSIIPHSKGGGKRNSKPFDGAEIQFLNLTAKSFTVDIKDPSLGVLTKFKFEDASKPIDVSSPFKIIFALVVLLGAVYFYFTWFKDAKKAKEEA